MNPHDRNDSADERFERLLIDSAQSDELPRNVDAAWDKFGAALNGVSVLAAGAGGALAVRRAQHWLAAKWLIWGALTGSALTALGLRASHDRHLLPSPAPSASIALTPVTSSTPAPRGEVEVAPPEPAPLPRATPKVLLHSIRAQTPPSHREAAPTQASSTLTEQVALLDAARSAVLAGAFSEALRLADRYRAQFPNGELAPEAEVVAIEALTLRGQRQPALERAARFLARYPGDPHTARVKWLVR
jgi:hypothetical protein